MYQPKTISASELVEDGKHLVYGANGVIGRYDKFNHAEAQLTVTCRGATCGSVNITEPYSWITGNAMVIRPKSNSLDVRFLEYLFRGGLDISKAITGAAQPQITRANLNPIQIRFPGSIKEQKRIVEFLDKTFQLIDSVITTTEKNLFNVGDLLESIINRIFGQALSSTASATIGELAEIRYGFTQSASAKPIGPRFLRITDIQEHEVNWESVPYCNVTDSEFVKYRLMDGDIVFARTGATTGKSFLVRDPPEAVFASYLIRVQLTTHKLMPEFVQYFFQTRMYWNEIQAGIVGSAQGGFNATKLAALRVPVPSIQEQQKVVETLDNLSNEVDNVRAIYERKLFALRELKKSILKSAFSGDLDGKPENLLDFAVG